MIYQIKISIYIYADRDNYLFQLTPFLVGWTLLLKNHYTTVDFWYAC